MRLQYNVQKVAILYICYYTLNTAVQSWLVSHNQTHRLCDIMYADSYWEAVLANEPLITIGHLICAEILLFFNFEYYKRALNEQSVITN